MMNATPAPAWFRPAALLGLLWNAYGCYMYLQTVGVFHGMQPAGGTGMPAWVTGAFAIAVFGGLLGCIGLLILKSWARMLLYLSLLAILAMDVWTFMMRGDGGDMVGAELGLTVAVLLIGLLLAWMGMTAAKRGWLS
jgi:hypothetical protein